MDFLQRNGLVSDFSGPEVQVHKNSHGREKKDASEDDPREDWKIIYDTVLKENAKVCVVAAMDPESYVVDECSIPRFEDTN